MEKYQFAAVVLILVALSGCAGNQEEAKSNDKTASTTAVVAATTAENTQMLNFCVEESEELGFTCISPDELGAENDVSMVYGSLTEVDLTWDGEIISLPQAIREERLTVPELFAFARMDAQNGFCQESYTSEHGLTHFCYAYPECELWLAYDVYETPDGGQTLINEVHIYNIDNSQKPLDITYVDEDNEWGYFLDREDWGLTFEVISASPTQITVNYSQQQGQEIGELSVTDFSLYSRSAPGTLDTYLGQFSFAREGRPIPIQTDGSGQITFDWTDIAGALEPGEYYIKATVVDTYDESAVHPLMDNFYDRQSYHIVFSVG